jgi:ligand-binding sensor domain-containing protein
LFYHINAQEPISVHLTGKDDLPDIEFYDLFEDENGLIWLAADKGLYKYDGKNTNF